MGACGGCGGSNGELRLGYAIRDGRAARAPGEATLGRGALDALHAHVGGDVSLHVAGRTVTLHVVGRHIEPDDEGRVWALPGWWWYVVAIAGAALLAAAISALASRAAVRIRPAPALRAE